MIIFSSHIFLKNFLDDPLPTKASFKDKDTHIKTTIKPIQALFVFQIFRARGFDTFFYF